MDQNISQNQDQNQTQIQVSQSLEDIQNKIAEAFGFSGTIDEKQQELLEKATDVLLKNLFLETIEKLSEEDADGYTKLIEEEAPAEEIQRFLSEKIPDYKNITQKVVDDFINGMKETGNIQNAQ